MCFFCFRIKTRSLQSQCTREDCIYYISTVNFILKWLCSLKVTKRKCLLLRGSSLACSSLQHGAAKCSVLHAGTFWAWVREQWDCCWGMLAQDITARSFPLAILQVEFEDVSAFSPTLVAWGVALKSLYVRLGLVWKSSRNTLWGMGYDICPSSQCCPWRNWAG